MTTVYDQHDEFDNSMMPVADNYGIKGTKMTTPNLSQSEMLMH